MKKANRINQFNIGRVAEDLMDFMSKNHNEGEMMIVTSNSYKVIKSDEIYSKIHDNNLQPGDTEF